MNKYLKINQTDLNVCRIGLGTVNAGLTWDGVDSFKIFDGYVKRGGNLIDCARVYSDWVKPEIGRAERVLGDWIRHRGRHGDLVIMTKGGHPRMDTMHISRLSRAEMESDLTLSLKALSVECIDVYFYHRDDVTRQVEDLVETMETFVHAGKIRYYGCSNWTTERMNQADHYCTRMGYRGFILNQALYNYGSQRMKPFPDKTMVTAGAAMLEYHANNLNNVLTPYMSLCSAFFHLLDEKGPEAAKDSPYYTKENLELYKKIKSIAAHHGTGITQVLLGFILTRNPDMLPLVSADNMEQLELVMDTFKLNFAGTEFDSDIQVSQAIRP
jgi:aryl-alcohol dehydrogenase-like predicted oxidoreductase